MYNFVNGKKQDMKIQKLLDTIPIINQYMKFKLNTNIFQAGMTLEFPVSYSTPLFPTIIPKETLYLHIKEGLKLNLEKNQSKYIFSILKYNLLENLYNILFKMANKYTLA